MLDAYVRIAGYACDAEAVPTCLLQCQLKTILLHKPILINYITNVLIFCVVFDNIFKICARGGVYGRFSEERR